MNDRDGALHMSSAKPSTIIGNNCTSRNLFCSVKIVISSLTKFFLVRKARKIENIRLHTWHISHRLSGNAYVWSTCHCFKFSCFSCLIFKKFEGKKVNVPKRDFITSTVVMFELSKKLCISRYQPCRPCIPLSTNIIFICTSSKYILIKIVKCSLLEQTISSSEDFADTFMLINVKYNCYYNC